ncbi:MAG: ECF-type sigma factor [Isosphaeraceae bacterium]
MAAVSTMPTGTITGWGESLRGGDGDAAAALWEAYFPRLVRRAQSVLRDGPLSGDAEDAALSAFQAFCHGMARGRFRALQGRNAIEALLVTITVRKARGYARRLASARNGARMARSPVEPDDLACPATDPAVLAAAEEAVAELLAALPDDTCRAVAALRAAGHTEVEVADRIGRCRATVVRKIRLIQQHWANRLP